MTVLKVWRVFKYLLSFKGKVIYFLCSLLFEKEMLKYNSIIEVFKILHLMHVL